MEWTNEDSEEYFQSFSCSNDPMLEELKTVTPSKDGLIATPDDWLDTSLWIKNLKEKPI
jgi:hypothetical protein